MSGSSSRIAGSLNPPIITELDASQGLPPSILLDARVYFADRKNSTTVTVDTGKGHGIIQVSICVAEPPALSYVCIHCPGLTEASFSDEPRVVRSEKQFLLLHISLWGTGFEERVDEYYMYQASIRNGKKPKLVRIPDLGPDLRDWFALDDFGIYCGDDDGEECILAGLTYFRGYDLHSYSSTSKVWTARPAHLDMELERLLMTRQRMPVAAHKVIPLGGGILGWVDLWKGILVCDVLCQDPRVAVGFIPLPLTGNTYDHICPWVIRDISCNNGSLKFVEIRHLLSVPPPVANKKAPLDLDVMYDETYFASPQDEQTEPPKYVDWRATVWNRSLSENCWRKGFEVHGNDIVLDGELGDCTIGISSSVRNLLPSFPTLSICGDHVVHMSSSKKFDIDKTQMISIDMSNSTLKASVPCPPVVADDDRPYFSCVLSKYLSNSPALPQVTQSSISENVNQGLPQIVQASNSRNIIGNKRPRSCAQEVTSESNRRAQDGRSNFDPSLVVQARNSKNVDVDQPQIVQPSYDNYQHQPIHLPNWLHLPNRFPPRPVNPHPAISVVNTASFRPTVHPFPQNDIRLRQTPSQVNPHPAYPVVNMTSFRPMVHPFPQFSQNDLRLLQAPSQALLRPTHFSTPSVRPAVGCHCALGSRHGCSSHVCSHRMT